MIPMIKGERADYSASLFKIRGVSIVYKESGEFVDVLKGVFPDYMVRKIFSYHLSKRLKKDTLTRTYSCL